MIKQAKGQNGPANCTNLSSLGSVKEKSLTLESKQLTLCQAWRAWAAKQNLAAPFLPPFGAGRVNATQRRAIMGWFPPSHPNTACPYSLYLYFLTTPKFPPLHPPAPDPPAWKKGYDSCWHRVNNKRTSWKCSAFHKVQPTVHKLIAESQPDPSCQVSSSTVLTKAVSGSSPSTTIRTLLHRRSSSAASETKSGLPIAAARSQLKERP